MMKNNIAFGILITVLTVILFFGVSLIPINGCLVYSDNYTRDNDVPEAIETITYSPQSHWTLEEVREYIALPDGVFIMGFTATGSMKPTLNENTLGLFITGDDAQIGDVVNFTRDNGMNVTHRIVGEMGNFWLTKGDATDVRDPDLVPKGNIRGRLVAIFY